MFAPPEIKKIAGENSSFSPAIFFVLISYSSGEAPLNFSEFGEFPAGFFDRFSGAREDFALNDLQFRCTFQERDYLLPVDGSVSGQAVCIG